MPSKILTLSTAPDVADVPLGDDLLKGTDAIATFIGESRRRTFYLLERRYIPCGKLGATWIASKRSLRSHYAAITGATA